MTFFAADNLRAVTAGRWHRRPDPLAVVQGVTTDSREAVRDRVFVALAGDRYDGHDFVRAAGEAGAAVVVVSRPLGPDDVGGTAGILVVEDTRRALGQMARAYRRTLRGTRVIAITGSSGKTTTKSLIDAILSRTLTGRAAPRSFNNAVGVPLTLLSAQPRDQYLVVEVGTSAPGEIAHLGAMAEPDIAVITAVGRAHFAGFGSVEAIAREKGSLLAQLGPDGAAIVNAEAPGLAPCLRVAPHVIRYGATEEADLRLTGRGSDADGWWFEINDRFRFPLALAGRHNALNAIAALAVARRLGVSDEVIAAGLAAVEPPPMRLAPRRIGPSGDAVTVINDAYNANPESMAAALEAFVEMAPDARRRVVILGAMLELGEAGAALHRELGRRVGRAGAEGAIDHAVFVGTAGGAAAARRGWSAACVDSVRALTPRSLERICRLVEPGDAVLIKASRGVGLERVVETLEARFGRERSSSATIEIADASSKRRRRTRT